MMEKICLDFETALDFLMGDPSTIEKLKYYADREEICITSLTLMQLLETIKKEEVIINFSNSVSILPFDKRAAGIATKLNREIRMKGELPKPMDSVLTASICIANDAFIFTRNAWKFEGIRGLRKV
jgi:predicted nucleic acid-binding protein